MNIFGTSSLAKTDLFHAYKMHFVHNHFLERTAIVIPTLAMFTIALAASPALSAGRTCRRELRCLMRKQTEEMESASSHEERKVMRVTKTRTAALPHPHLALRNDIKGLTTVFFQRVEKMKKKK